MVIDRGAGEAASVFERHDDADDVGLVAVHFLEQHVQPAWDCPLVGVVHGEVREAVLEAFVEALAPQAIEVVGEELQPLARIFTLAVALAWIRLGKASASRPL